jgi:hypothetical protein
MISHNLMAIGINAEAAWRHFDAPINEREHGEETANHPAIIGHHSLAFPLLITRRYADYATILAKVNGRN